MNFRLTDEQEMLQKMVQDFSAKEVEPTASVRDEEEQFDRGIFDQLADLGLTGIPWPETYGGIGSDMINHVLVIEELSRACAATGATLSAHVSLVSWAIFTYGNEQQKQIFLRRLATGESLGTYALSETDMDAQATPMKTLYRSLGDEYIMNGRKTWVTNGGVADIYLVFSQGDQGMTAFIIEAGTKGFTIGKKEQKLGICSSPATELIFKDCHIPMENRLGEEGQGLEILQATFEHGKNGIAAQAIGIAQAALDAAVKYAKERKQFGKPIANNQGISFKLAHMATKVAAARLLTYQAASLETNGLPAVKAAEMSKRFSIEVAVQITVDAVQVFGGYGYTRDYPVERYMRDIQSIQMYEEENTIAEFIKKEHWQTTS